MLPNFLIIGSAKAGSTSLYRYLSNHPEIFMPELKEPHFFSRAEVFSKGLDWYEDLFEGATDRHLAVGEASVSYSAYPRYLGVAQRIVEYLGPIKVIYLIRHPIERMRSHYYNHVGQGVESREINDALLNDDDLLTRSMYALQIEQFLSHLPRENILLIRTEEMGERRNETLREAFKFLGVDPEWTSPTLHEQYNSTATNRPIRPIIQRLRRYRVFGALSSRIPSTLKVALDQRFNIVSVPINRRGTLLDSTRKELEDRLRPDLGRLRSYMGPSFDAWGLLGENAERR